MEKIKVESEETPITWEDLRAILVILVVIAIIVGVGYIWGQHDGIRNGFERGMTESIPFCIPKTKL